MARLVARSLLMFITAVTALYVVAIVGGITLSRLGQPVWPASPVAFAAALLLSRFVWTRTETPPSTLRSAIVLGALLAGAAGFVIGFFGPVVLRPGTNQGAVLGLFITGPVGALVGAIGGGIAWIRRRATPPARA